VPFGLLPAALAGVVLSGVVLGILLLTGASVSSPLGLVGIVGLAAASFAAVNQALVSVFGSVGRMVSLAFLAVQAGAVGGLAPIESAPGAQLLNGILPLPQLVTGAGQLLLGG